MKLSGLVRFQCLCGYCMMTRHELVGSRSTGKGILSYVILLCFERGVLLNCSEVHAAYLALTTINSKQGHLWKLIIDTNVLVGRQCFYSSVASVCWDGRAVFVVVGVQCLF